MPSLLKLVASNEREFWGWFFIVIGSLLSVGFIYAATTLVFLSPLDNAIIHSVQSDWYYCLLVPLTLPILVVAVYFHWLCMKLFKHA